MHGLGLLTQGWESLQTLGSYKHQGETELHGGGAHKDVTRAMGTNHKGEAEAIRKHSLAARRIFLWNHLPTKLSGHRLAGTALGILQLGANLALPFLESAKGPNGLFPY